MGSRAPVYMQNMLYTGFALLCNVACIMVALKHLQYLEMETFTF